MKALSDVAISVKWTPPADTRGIEWYTATATPTGAGTSQNCEVAKGQVTCEVGSLKAYSDYTVSLVACDKQASGGNRVCSNAVTKSGTVKTFQSGE